MALLSHFVDGFEGAAGRIIYFSGVSSFPANSPRPPKRRHLNAPRSFSSREEKSKTIGFPVMIKASEGAPLTPTTPRERDGGSDGVEVPMGWGAPRQINGRNHQMNLHNLGFSGRHHIETKRIMSTYQDMTLR